MRPVLIEIPLPGGLRIPLHAFGVMIVIGFLLACHVGDREARRRGLPDFMYDLGLVMLLTGIAGGRLFYYFQFYDERFAGESFLEIFKIWKGGLVFYGGAIVGFLGGLVYCMRRKLPVAECLDIAAIATPLAMAVGRLGCFLNGCCFGKVCAADYPLGVVFPLESNARAEQLARGLVGPESPALPIHPVQLYQAGHDFLMFALLIVFLRMPGNSQGRRDAPPLRALRNRPLRPRRVPGRPRPHRHRADPQPEPLGGPLRGLRIPPRLSPDQGPVWS